VEVGADAIFPTSTLATSLNPSVGIYVNIGSEFFLDQTRHSALFFEVGDGGTFGSAAADKLQGAPLIGSGFSVMAGFRYYF
jgi:hypothetical protein